MTGALDGIVVLDLTHLVAGPYCAMVLADLGAEVIKIERPGGASERALEPFVNGVSAFHLTLNRNKRSVTLDLKSEKARAAFLKIASQADVVLENFRPGVTKRMGIDSRIQHAAGNRRARGGRQSRVGARDIE